VAAIGLLLALTYSAAWDLSDEDYDNLRRRRVSNDILNLSPKEWSRLHYLINNAQPDAAARDKNVKDTLGLFLGHQLWEKAHPKELWDDPKK
jgi:hypothetical protein